MSAPAAGDENTLNAVQDYYGKQLQKSTDLKNSACTAPPVKMPGHVREALGMVHKEVVDKFFGCGMVIPEVMENRAILDLGSGSGRDSYMLAYLVGEKGSVTGIDMTPELVTVSNDYSEYHREKYGYKQANTKFIKGYIENLTAAGLQPNSFDILVSNGVFNLCPDKRAVLKAAYPVLKDGGELYFSDIYADRQLEEEIRKNKLLWGECLSGALYWKDLYSLAEEVGFTSPRLVTGYIRDIEKPDLKEAVKGAEFASATYRLFKLPAGSNRGARDVTYNGNIRGSEQEFKFDYQYTFKAGEVKTVDGETAAILTNSRFRDYFSIGDSKPNGSTPQDSLLNPFECVRSA